MKFKGNSISRETRTLELPRTNGDKITLVVSSITVGVRRDFDSMWPKPKAPLIVEMGKNGRTEREDWRDEKFGKELEERATLQNIYLLYRVLENDPNITFDTKPIDKDSIRALSEEIKQSGLSEGDIIVILREALKASNLSQEEIEKAKSDF